MIANDDFRRLLAEAQAGDASARDTLLEGNLNLVRSVAYRFVNRGAEWDDLFQIGSIGLLKAIERFDPRYDVRFSTYAVPMIIGEIRRFLRDDSPVKVARPLKELAYRIARARDSLQAGLGREPSVSEIAAELGVSVHDAVAAMDATRHPASLFEEAFQETGEGPSPLLLSRLDGTAETAERQFDRMVLNEVVARLPQRERTVISLRFFADRTQAEIAAVIGLSQVQVSRIEKQALKLIRDLMQAR